MNKVLFIVTSLWLVGCATLSYQEPMQGLRAQVRFVSTSNSPTVLRAYDDIGCTQNEMEWMRLWVGKNGNPKKLGMPLWNYDESAAKEVYVAAGKQMNGMFFGSESMGLTVYSCGVPFSFTFSANTDYEVKYLWSPRQCLVTISQIIPNGSGWALKEVGRFDNRTNSSNRGCLEKFGKPRLY